MALQGPGLLLEPARTNAFTFPEDLSNAAWTKTAVTISANATTAPDGTSTADKIVEDSSASTTHRIDRATPTLTNSTSQAFSLFAKAAENSEIAMQTVGKAGSARYTYFDLSAGTIGTTDAGHTARMVAYDDDWYRCSVIWNAGTGGSTPFTRVFLTDGAENITFSGDGTSGVYVWGLQFEVDRAVVSSYKPGETSAFARAADTAYMAYTEDPAAGQVYLRFRELGTIASSGKVWSRGDPNSAGGYMEIDVSGGFFRARHYNGSTASTATLAAAPSHGNLVELLVTHASNGAVTIAQSIGEATATSATGSAAAYAGSWNVARDYLGSGGGANQGFMQLLGYVARSGTSKDIAFFRSLF